MQSFGQNLVHELLLVLSKPVLELRLGIDLRRGPRAPQPGRSRRITGLGHEILDYPVEGRSIVETLSGKEYKAIHSKR